MSLKSLARRFAHKSLQRIGYDLHRFPPQDFDAEALDLLRYVSPYTATSPERLIALRDAIRHLDRTGVAGSVVETGVWRGGSMMAAALTLINLGNTERELFLFDTFEGMTQAGVDDVRVDGAPAPELLAGEPRTIDSGWMVASLQEVEANMASTGYPREKVSFVKGRVEDTLPDRAPGEIALLRLDTDWYSSIRHGLTHLFPRIQPGGVLILDDYGHWGGAQKAVDEYLDALQQRPFLHRVDDTCRLAIVSGR